ncbi:GNAT family N-acetyltransferase [Ottowia sp. GY511]|uniref:GNAT family N-acetyltransferase n=1 Tax=Ottowia flava TaxID=2675430 RepID=A0ABW4KRX1_9BURK|nr:GNAT family N-acetyltransferase [Ottowia sp. GY511]TXK33604.1 GNAT family N-acetyltransferase [Ottowia sp. GY511]
MAHRAPPHLDTPATLRTERLVLRPWCDSDRAPFAALNADAETMRFFPEPLTRAESDALADRCQALIAMRGWGFWAVERQDNGAFIGMLGLHVPAPDLPFSPCVEVGWRLAREHWGQGLATEGARAALAFGFDRLGLDEIVSFTTVTNTPSQAVMQRLGMQRDVATFEHPALPVGHPLREHVLCRVLSGDLANHRSTS